jgi:hypothetical protein
MITKRKLNIGYKLEKASKKELIIISKLSSSIPQMMQLIINNERKMILMNEAKQLTSMNPDNSPIKRSYSATPTEQINPISCPCSVEEVYSIGIKLQYLTGDMYLKYANTSKGFPKDSLKALAIKQLDRKAEIQKLANLNLNEKLAYFYNNGGPIIEPPVSVRQAKEINGFFNRIVANYLNQMDVIISKATKVNDSFNELEVEINKIIIRMLTDLANLYHDDDIRLAFKEMISL